MSRFLSLATVAALVLLAQPTAAQEYDLLRRHSIQGSEGGVDFSGSLEIQPDARYTLERRFQNGQVQVERGVVRMEESDFVLTHAVGAVGVLGAGSTDTDRYTRKDSGDSARLRHEDGQDWTSVELHEKDGRLTRIWRALKNGREWNWLFNRNRGSVDETAGAEIFRSRQPRPRDVLRYKKKGLKTILSLNGDQDKEAKHYATVAVTRGGRASTQRQRVKVNLRQFIRDEGIEHHYVQMGSTKAPTDQQLVTVFRVLLDDSKKPLLLHCTGGADRTGVIGALYRFEFMGWSKARAKKEMRKRMWTANRGTDVQGAYFDLYQLGRIRDLLQQDGFQIPTRYATRPQLP